MDFLPDELDDGLCRLAVGTQTDGCTSSELIILELGCDSETKFEEDPWLSWPKDYCKTGLMSLEGFGCTDPDGAPQPLRAAARFQHPIEEGDVNRVSASPHKSRLIATRSAKGNVRIFDGSTASASDALRATLTPSGPSVEGFALSWCRVDSSLIATGGDDGRLYVWDVEASVGSGGGGAKARAPFHDFVAHDAGAMCDASFSPFERGLLATVGDVDRSLRLWDLRSASRTSNGAMLAPAQQAVVSEEEVLSVGWCFKQERILATAGKDRVVRIWDTRSLREPLRSLRGHTDDAVCVRWAPFREGLLASCSADQKVIVWDLEQGEPEPALEQEKAGDPEHANDSPELLFTHSGHTQGVADVAWGAMDWLLGSVAYDNKLQLWQPQTAFYMDDSDDDAGDLCALLSRPSAVEGTAAEAAEPAEGAEPREVPKTTDAKTLLKEETLESVAGEAADAKRRRIVPENCAQ